MTQEERNWWEALADQYLYWLDNGGPTSQLGYEIYSCIELHSLGFTEDCDRLADSLCRVWRWFDGRFTEHRRFPCGKHGERGYREKQAVFFEFMYHTIRDYLDYEVMPWENAL